MSKELIIQQIKSGDQNVLSDIYIQYREEFIYWLVKRYNCEVIDATDIYQLTIVIFYDNVVTGKLKELTGSVKTYLFSIGKNKFLEQQRAQSKIRLESDPFFFDHITPNLPKGFEQQELKLNQVENSLKILGDPCKTILEMFYYYKFSMQEITVKMDYKNEGTTKNMKYKCLKRLQGIFEKETKKNTVDE